MPNINAWAPAELAWGLAATSMGLVRTDHEFHAVRFLLGTADCVPSRHDRLYRVTAYRNRHRHTCSDGARILRSAGWPLRRIGKARPLGSTVAVAGYLEASSRALARVHTEGGLHDRRCGLQSRLWLPDTLL